MNFSNKVVFVVKRLYNLAVLTINIYIHNNYLVIAKTKNLRYAEVNFFGDRTTRNYGDDFDHFRLNVIDTPGFQDNNEVRFKFLTSSRYFYK